MLLHRTIINLVSLMLLLFFACVSDAQFVPFPGKKSTGTMGGGPKSALDCVSSGGRIVSISISERICQFDAPSCPGGGWTAKDDWTTTTAKTCTSTCGSCTTASHAFGDLAPELCAYDVLLTFVCVGGGSCQANVTQVGCK